MSEIGLDWASVGWQFTSSTTASGSRLILSERLLNRRRNTCKQSKGEREKERLPEFFFVSPALPAVCVSHGLVAQIVPVISIWMGEKCARVTVCMIGCVLYILTAPSCDGNPFVDRTGPQRPKKNPVFVCTVVRLVARKLHGRQCTLFFFFFSRFILNSLSAVFCRQAFPDEVDVGPELARWVDNQGWTAPGNILPVIFRQACVPYTGPVIVDVISKVVPAVWVQAPYGITY
ncbi:hypothetical protein F4861DRAFT_514808 [Xylaria intraflava]|nr:hypothetical protein F4861DRAFT_514808 [Xylaria intraflava]